MPAPALERLLRAGSGLPADGNGHGGTVCYATTTGPSGHAALKGGRRGATNGRLNLSAAAWPASPLPMLALRRVTWALVASGSAAELSAP